MWSVLSVTHQCDVFQDIHVQALCGYISYPTQKQFPFGFYIVAAVVRCIIKSTTRARHERDVGFLQCVRTSIYISRCQAPGSSEAVLRIANQQSCHNNRDRRHIERNYRKFSNIRRTRFQNLSASRPVLQLSLPNLLKPCIESGMKM